ncbi:MAG: wapA 1 [Bacillales bacterium]|nr:wapA 1 [Bacillales bacterium]
MYNVAGRLAEVKKHDGTLVASYDYDENGLRTRKTLGNIETEYYYSNNILTLESIKDTTLDRIVELHEFNYDKNGNVASMIQTLIAEDSSKTTNLYYYITNHRGDVVKMLDSNKSVVAEYSYDAFGNILSQTGTLTDTNPIRYAGYYYDSETKHYYLKARYYDPVNGNFQALDPHPGDSDDLLSQNGYTYAANNPVMFVDPDGQLSKNAIDNIITGLLIIAGAVAWVFGAEAIAAAIVTAASWYTFYKISTALIEWYKNPKSKEKRKNVIKELTFAAIGAGIGRIGKQLAKKYSKSELDDYVIKKTTEFYEQTWGGASSFWDMFNKTKNKPKKPKVINEWDWGYLKWC